jgi:putative ABC transport system ATP-binding protein
MRMILQAVHVSRSFGSSAETIHVLKHVNMAIPRNSLTVLKGRSGSGKTTLLNLLGALDRPTEGEIYFEETEIGRLSEKKREELRRTQMGFVFQSFALFPLLSAQENVEFGLRIAGIASKEWKSRTEEALELVGLTKRARHRPYEMSGGEQQRCAIARAIAHHPKIILADEPTGELDSKMTRQVMQVFKKLIKEKNLTILMTTHDPSVMGEADHVYELEDGHVSNASKPSVVEI